MGWSVDGYARWVRERGEQLQDRHQRLQARTPDRMTINLDARTNGNGVVELCCGLYRFVYGISPAPGGYEARYLEDRSYPIPGINPTEQALMGAAVDAHCRAQGARR